MNLCTSAVLKDNFRGHALKCKMFQRILMFFEFLHRSENYSIGVGEGLGGIAFYFYF